MAVREALRALELVGLIETRRGEGTFIRNFYDNGLVQLIAPFLLQDEKTIRDLLQTKRLLEKDMIRIVCNLPKETFSKVLSKLHQVLEGNENSIGYIYFGYVDDAINALKVNDVEPTADNVTNSSYPIARPFLLVDKQDGLSENGKKLIDFVLSEEGQQIMEDEGFIKINK